MKLLELSKTLRPRVVFSGIQPTGIPHLGNYIGALKQWVQFQHQEEPATELIFSIVDLHALTTSHFPDQLRLYRRQSLAALLAIGLDPERCTLFYQSAVPAHSELMWILACSASMGYLSRMTQWKVGPSFDPSKLSMSMKTGLEDRLVVSKLKLGLFSYPVLQAADILVHRATHVPVGHDQQQHLEFARECVTKFNHAYGPCLIYPETITPPVQRIMSLTEPIRKMSKSHQLERSRILITDTPHDIRAKISTSLTDSFSGISYDPIQRPGISNLLEIFSAFDVQGRSSTQLATEYAETQPRLLKEMVSDAVIVGLSGIRDRYLELLNANSERLDAVEAEGGKKARQSAEATMKIVKDAIGL